MVLTRMEDAEQTHNCNTEDWIDVLSRSTEKPRMEYCEANKNGTLVYFRAVKRPLSWFSNQSKLVFFEPETVELERTLVPHEQLFQL